MGVNVEAWARPERLSAHAAANSPILKVTLAAPIRRALQRPTAMLRTCSRAMQAGSRETRSPRRLNRDGVSALALHARRGADGAKAHDHHGPGRGLGHRKRGALVDRTDVER